MNKSDYAYKRRHQKPKINVLPDDIKFVHADGTLATNAVASVGVDEETGEVIFYELLGQTGIGDIPYLSVNGKNVYRRVMIQRVYPVLNEDTYLDNLPELDGYEVERLGERVSDNDKGDNND